MLENSLVAFFNQHIELDSKEIDYLIKNVPIVDLENNAILLKEGEVSSAFYFVIKGCIRMYYLVDGIEKTTFFYKENDFVSSYESFIKQVPSKHCLQSLKETKVAIFDAHIVNDIVKRFPRFEVLARITMENELSIYQDMIASFVTLNGEQRYLKLLKDQPELIQEIPQYHIATYLGVSPETLSRIRNRISRKTLE